MDAAGKSKPDVVTLAPEMLTARDHGLHVEVAAVAAQSVGSLRSLAYAVSNEFSQVRIKTATYEA